MLNGYFYRFFSPIRLPRSKTVVFFLAIPYNTVNKKIFHSKKMATLLLIIIYIAYIGLGIPDSLFGTAWPAVYEELHLPLFAANAVTLLISGGTILSSLLSARLINRFGTGIVTAASTTLTAIALLGFSLSGNLFFLCLCAVPLGLGAGAIDAAQNNYVALHYNARHMSFLHCFYGVGVAISPYLMSLGIQSGNWRSGYFWAFCLQAAISIIAILTVPLWKKAHPEPSKTQDIIKTESPSLWQLAKLPAIRATWLMFIASCSIEATCTQWGSTFFVQTQNLSAGAAAKIVILYFVGLTLGRFVSGLLAKRLTSWKLIQIGCGILLFAIVLLALPVSHIVIPCIGLFLTGFGIGPIYPNLTYLTPINFNKEQSQAVIGSQLAFTYVGVMLSPVLFGFLAQLISTTLFPYYLGLLFVLFTFAMLRLISILKKQNKYEIQILDKN